MSAPALHPDSIEATLHETWVRLSSIGQHNARVYKMRGMEMPYGCCQECTNEIDNFMLTAEVWASLPVNESSNLCLTCTEKLLGRPFLITDFTTAPINRAIMMGFKIGRAFSEAPHAQA